MEIAGIREYESTITLFAQVLTVILLLILSKKSFL